jgi:hypothetical protein
MSYKLPATINYPPCQSHKLNIYINIIYVYIFFLFPNIKSTILSFAHKSSGISNLYQVVKSEESSNIRDLGLGFILSLILILFLNSNSNANDHGSYQKAQA